MVFGIECLALGNFGIVLIHPLLADSQYPPILCIHLGVLLHQSTDTTTQILVICLELIVLFQQWCLAAVSVATVVLVLFDLLCEYL